MEMRIRIEDYSKKIRKDYVLNHVNLELLSGNIYGIVGQNGSGKTMLLRAISGLIHPTTGKIYIDEKQLFKDFDFPENIGILIEKPDFLSYLSGFENLKLLSEIRGKATEEHDKKVEDLKKYLNMFNLDSESKQSMKKFSLGMKQKIGIIQAIMEEPDVLVLVEPFNALDQEAVKLLRELLLNFQNKGKLVVITSHHKDDIESVCNKIIRIDRGQIV